MSDDVLSVLSPGAGAGFRQVVLFPGGGNGPAAYASWVPQLPERWRVTAVCLPGRGARLAEPLPASLPAVADEVAAALGRDDRSDPARSVYFGHSMGALVALEVAVRRTPALLVTAACAPVVEPAVYGDPDQEKVRDVVRRRARAQGIEDAAFIEELADVTAPILRADLLLLDGYRLPGPLVTCPIASFYGTGDPVPALSWAGRTTAGATTSIVDGDHYFFQSGAQFLVDLAEQRGTETS